MLLAQQHALHRQRLEQQRFGGSVLAILLLHVSEIVELLGEVRMGKLAAHLALHVHGALHERDGRFQVARRLRYLGQVLQRSRNVAVCLTEQRLLRGERVAQ